MNQSHYNKLTIFISILAFVIMSVKLFYDYTKLKNINSNTKFPPWPSKCPDYWEVLDNNQCKNVYKIGDCKSIEADNIMDFSEPIFQGSKGIYYKCNWANKCNIPWEGVDNIC
jgi:hypothetical protein